MANRILDAVFFLVKVLMTRKKAADEKHLIAKFDAKKCAIQMGMMKKSRGNRIEPLGKTICGIDHNNNNISIISDGH